MDVPYIEQPKAVEAGNRPAQLIRTTPSRAALHILFLVPVAS
jgi:hypothetical protein